MCWWRPVSCIPVRRSHQSLTHDGPFWVQTANGTFSAANANRLRITASGNVTLRGDVSDRVVYTLTRRMRAQSEQEARALLRGFEVRTTTRGDWMYLTVTSPGLKTVSADVSITVPRSMHEAWIATSGGNVQAYDFDGHLEAQTRGGQVQIDRIKPTQTVRAGGGLLRTRRAGSGWEVLLGGGNICVESAAANRGLRPQAARCTWARCWVRFT